MRRLVRALGVDHGDVRIGIALSDALRMFAQPLCTIENQGYQKSAAAVLSLAILHEVTTVVLGLPLELDGSIGPQAKKAERFAKKLQSVVAEAGARIEVILWDERMSSAHAERILVGSKLKGKDKHSAVDRVAAALILESYLSSTRT